ncbi:methylase [Pseudolactococcus insecticola]|nr:methylase [Lactococcus insecticola]
MNERLIKSKHRVQKHGEVFTPSWMVEKMLDTQGVKEDTYDVTKTFLEPAAGDGNFLVAILKRKLVGVKETFSSKYWQTKSLFALSSIYGIEFLADNLEIARYRLFLYYLDWYEETFGQKLSSRKDIYKSANFLIQKNIVRGNTLTKCHPETGAPILFNEWRRVKGSASKVERVEFSFAELLNEKITLESGIPEGQLSLFDLEGDDTKQKKKIATIIDIQKVYQLEGK